MSDLSFEFEPVDSCVLCGTRERLDARGVSWVGVAFSYCICSGCGLKYMRPRPTEETYKIFYSDQYWQQNLEASGFKTNEGYDDPRVDQLALRMPKYQSVYRKVKQHLAEAKPLDRSSRVLEVGCAFGYTLEWLKRDLGCQTFGIEPSESARERCREAGVPMVAHTAEDFVRGQGEPGADEPYDVIFFRHCLATIPDPVLVMKGLRSALKSDGLMLIYTVNVEYYDAMDPFHPNLYSPDTLKRLLLKCGFDPYRIDASPSPSDHGKAVRVLEPSYEIVAFARPGPEHELPLGTLDPREIAKRHTRGQMVVNWSRLGARDLVTRLGLKAAARGRAQLT
jgi:SAM-dependent methyltransferase